MIWVVDERSGVVGILAGLPAFAVEEDLSAFLLSLCDILLLIGVGLLPIAHCVGSGLGVALLANVAVGALAVAASPCKTVVLATFADLEAVADALALLVLLVVIVVTFVVWELNSARSALQSLISLALSVERVAFDALAGASMGGQIARESIAAGAAELVSECLSVLAQIIVAGLVLGLSRVEYDIDGNASRQDFFSNRPDECFFRGIWHEFEKADLEYSSDRDLDFLKVFESVEREIGADAGFSENIRRPFELLTVSSAGAAIRAFVLMHQSVGVVIRAFVLQKFRDVVDLELS